MWVRLAVLGLVAIAALIRPVRAESPVDLDLVLAVDVSLSMAEDEAKLQRHGYSAALSGDKPPLTHRSECCLIQAFKATRLTHLNSHGCALSADLYKQKYRTFFFHTSSLCGVAWRRIMQILSIKTNCSCGGRL